jgi:hypothetical protein
MGICFSDFLDQQRREALGPVNKWYCSQFYGYEVNDPETLLAYYIKHGGASRFREEHCCDLNNLAASANERR